MELAEGARSSRSAWKFALGDLWREGRDLPCTSSEICATDVRAGVCMTGGLWKPSGQAADHGPWSRSGKLQHDNSSVGWLCRLQEEARSWRAIRLRASCCKGKAGCLGMVLGFSLFGKNGFFFSVFYRREGPEGRESPIPRPTFVFRICLCLAVDSWTPLLFSNQTSRWDFKRKMDVIWEGDGEMEDQRATGKDNEN